MGILINRRYADRLRQALCQNEPGNLQVQLYKVLMDRVERNTREDKLVQTGDTQEWYHLVWERMADAAFAYYMEPNEKLGRWVHDRTMEIVKMPLDGWVGPWYRERNPEFQIGVLETAHITLAVCEAYENASDVFTEEEKAEIAKAVTEKGMVLCRRFAERGWCDKENAHVSNWHLVLLCGYGVAAAMFQVEEDIKYAMELEANLSSIYNKDSYGETVQYSNYASLCLNHLHRVMVNAGYANVEDIHPRYFDLMEWYAYSFQRMKYMESFDTEVSRTFAFGDSANVFRPTADVLVQTAVWGKETHPVQAALASWLFYTIYSKETGLIDEMATFGFFNQFTYDAILRMPDMAVPKSPEELGLPLTKRFEIGHVITRDNWTAPKMQVAIAAGYEPLNVTAHRHRDQNSFQLTLGDERMLIDPGHCCYRLVSQKKSLHETSHNGISILCGDKLLEQRRVDGNIFNKKPVYNRLIAAETVNGITVVISDGTKLYDAPVERAVRIWLLKLPDMVMVIDDVAASEPVKLLTRFVANNRDNKLQVNDRSKHQLFLKRKGAELGIHVVQNLVDGEENDLKLIYDWTYLHEYYHPLPNQKPQGKEGSALVYVWESTLEAKVHRRVHLIEPCHRATLFKLEECFAEYKLDYELTDDRFTLTVDGETKTWII